jgi:protein-arginine kinase activator protein McsA
MSKIRRKKEKKQLICANCNIKFTQTRAWSKFCSMRCRVEHWNKMNPRIKIAEMDQ